MKTKLAEYLNEQSRLLKINQKLEVLTGVPANFGIAGRKYGYRSSALRAIRNFITKHDHKLKQYDVLFTPTQCDAGRYEIDVVIRPVRP